MTTRITTVEGEKFKTDGKIIVDPGWLAVYGRQAEGEGESDKAIVPVRAGEPSRTEAVEVKESQTKPPARFTEATLLSAMEGAGKLVDDEELREAMSERGLGTPATRAQIIEGLLYEGYLIRQGRDLIVTAKGLSLITLLRELRAEALTKPELTGEWEFKLAQMEQGHMSRKEFMREIVAMTKHIVGQARGDQKSDTIPGDFATLTVPCPKCGGEVHEKYKKFQCVNCDFGWWKIMGGRQLEPAEAETLLRERAVGPLEGFRSRLGRPFSAKLKLNDANEVEFDFGPRLDGEDGEVPDFTGQTPLGPCPKCASDVFETPNAYVCSKAVGEGRTCDFRARAARSSSVRSSASRWRSCLARARPTCCSSCRRARGVRSRPSSRASPTARWASSSRPRIRR